MRHCDLPRSAGCLMLSSSSRVPAGAAELDGVRVLVVEDSWDVGTGLKMLLESWGADIAGPAATMADARRLALERSPAVALVDINLRNGEQSYELIDWLHERGVRIVVISGYPDVFLAKNKAIAILPKPMREDLLLASLRQVRQS
jgi:DNA-binding NtrC family response regulator